MNSTAVIPIPTYPTYTIMIKTIHWRKVGKVHNKPKLILEPIITYILKKTSFPNKTKYGNETVYNNETTYPILPFSPYFKIFDQLDLTLNGLAILLNLILLLFILTRRRLRKTTCSKFFMNLQVVHLFMCVNALTVDGYGISDEHLYISNGLLVEIFLALLLTTIDRFVAIKYPYFYQRVTTKMVFTIIGLSWLPGALFVIVLLFIQAATVVMALTTAILIAFAMLVLITTNMTIWIVVRKHIKAIQRNCRPSSQSNIKDEKAKIKSTFVCLSIVITFVLLWLPYLVHNIILLTKGLQYGIFTRSLDSIILLNAILDPWLYVVFRKDVKKEIKILIKKEREPETQLTAI